MTLYAARLVLMIQLWIALLLLELSVFVASFSTQARLLSRRCCHEARSPWKAPQPLRPTSQHTLGSRQGLLVRRRESANDNLQQEVARALVTCTLCGCLAVSMPVIAATDVSVATAVDSAPTTTTETTTITNVATISSTPSSSSSSATTAASADRRYWSLMQMDDDNNDDGNTATDITKQQDRLAANEALLDHAVGTINTMYYDNSGGFNFSPRDLYDKWRSLRHVSRNLSTTTSSSSTSTRQQQQQQQQHHTTGSNSNMPMISLDTREGAVRGLRWLVGTLNDPYSRYLTREDLRQELVAGSGGTPGSDGFLGLGAMVEPPPAAVLPLQQKLSSSSSSIGSSSIRSYYRKSSATTTNAGATAFVGTVDNNKVPLQQQQRRHSINNSNNKGLMTTTRANNLPVVTAVAPNSPAERAGVTVGDRIVAVGTDKFVGRTRSEVTKGLKTRYSADNYAGRAHVTLAKPLFWEADINSDAETTMTVDQVVGGPKLQLQQGPTRQVVTGYRLSKLKLETISNAPFEPQNGVLGDSIVQYKLLTSSDSILDQSSSSVGYIRLTRFSRASTVRFFDAIDKLEAAGAQSYIIDLRNNYGGVIQEAMLTASTLLRDPHSVLCYTMNSRGGFTPHDVEEYIVDTRYPGYLLSRESPTVTVNQVRRENPAMFDGVNVPPSSFASLHEQSMQRGIHRVSSTPVMMDNTVLGAKQWNAALAFPGAANGMNINHQLRMQKKIVLLINEGTASSAEVFASALHDNGRTVALVGSKTYGKGLIQHTFPMPDGGGLRLTVAEYLTPSLHHVTNVGSARYDSVTGDWIGGGIQPDIYCESKRGIPSNVGADFCVGMALDALEEADLEDAYNLASFGEDSLLKRVGGSVDGSRPRRPIVSSLVKDDF